MLLAVVLDGQTLLLAGALMGVFITVRPFVKACREWAQDALAVLRWLRRHTLDEVYARLHHLETQLDEHESDKDLHQAARRIVRHDADDV